jgi:phenylacetate-CoA ligase
MGGYIYGKKYIDHKKLIRKIKADEVEAKLIDLTNFSIKNVKYYRNRYLGIRINSIEEFKSKIKFIDKNKVMVHWDEFLADGIDMKQCKQGTTGGTSGRPLKLILPGNRYIVELATVHSLWNEIGWNYDMRGVIRNHRLSPDKIYVINPITKEIIFDAFRISAEYVKVIYKIIKNKKIKYIQAYPSAAYQFCKLCYKQNLNISFIKSFLCSSERITDEQYYFIHDKLGINIFNFYGHSEKLVIAGSNSGNNNLKFVPSYGYAELVDKDDRDVKNPGTTGEIVGTTFYNKYMPLIRYKTGDTAELWRVPEASNDGLIINKIAGRWDYNLIYRYDGTTTSITALNLHGDLYEHIDGMQYVQEKKGELIVLIIKNDRYTVETEKRFLFHFQRGLGAKGKVYIKYVDKLIFMPNGKFLPLISRITDEQ